MPPTRRHRKPEGADTVLNISTHAVTLDDGRSLAPGEEGWAELDNAHNEALLEDNHLMVVAEPPAETKDKVAGDGGNAAIEKEGDK